jgi:outer membrane protein insertion porin family
MGDPGVTVVKLLSVHVVCAVVQSKPSKLKSVPFLLGTTLAVTSILTLTNTKRVQAYVPKEKATAPTAQKFEQGWLPSTELVAQAGEADDNAAPDAEGLEETAEPEAAEEPEEEAEESEAAEEPEEPAEPVEGSTPAAPSAPPAIPVPPSSPPVGPDDAGPDIELPSGDEPADQTSDEAETPAAEPDAVEADPPEAEEDEDPSESEDEDSPEAEDEDPSESVTPPGPGAPGSPPGAPGFPPPPPDGTPAQPTEPGAVPPGAPAFPPPPPDGAPNQPAEPGAVEPAEPEPQVLVSEVAVEGADGDLALTVYEAISTRPGQPSTRSQIQSDINAIFATGFFNNVRAEPQDTPLGVRVTFFVQPNPPLRAVQVAGNQVLTQEKVDEIFSPQYGRILNLKELQTGIQAVNKYYQDEGYVLAQVVGTPQVDADGTVTLQVAEGVIEEIDVRYLNEDGEPTKGKTRKFIITRELDTKPGAVLNRNLLQTDLQRVFGLGLFEDVQVALEPGQDPRKVLVNLNVQERSTGQFSAGAGFSSQSGFFGTGSYSQSNFGGNNQDLNLQLQIGTREFLFDASFTDPWIATDPYGTSYTVNLFNRLTIPLVFDNGPFDDNPDCVAGDSNPASACNVRLPNGDRARVNRLGAGISFTRPLTKVRAKRARAWTASLGFQYQRVSVRDNDFDISPVDNLGNQLSFSGSGQDDLFTVQFGLGRDQRNDPLNPTKGWATRLGVEQWIPLGQGSIFGTRLRASYSYFVPVSLLRFTEGPQTLAFNVQGGTVIGDLPPYEAFTLGGGSSVRGFNEGDLGSGRSFLQATAEYRFPLFKFLGGVRGVLFLDYGTNLGSQDNVIGNPGLVRGKPGDGLGYGIGLRVNTPIGPVRLDYGRNDQGDDQFHFGFGERF